MVREMSDEMLEKVIAARRGMKVPAGPSEKLIEETLDRLGAGAGGLEESTTMKGWWTVKKVKWTAGLAAAAGLIVTIGVLWVAGQTRVAFADVMDNVKAATCVHFNMAGKVPQPNGVARDLKAEVWITQGGRMRQEVETAAGKMVMIQDMKEGKSLTLTTAAHQATVVEMTHAPAATQGQMQGNFLEQLKALQTKGAVSLGVKEVAGHKTEGFKVTGPTMDVSVWADVGTHMPVEVEETIKVNYLPQATMTMSDFVWNAEIDPALMSLTPPAGYTVQTMKMDMSATAEKDLVEALKAAAEMNGGRYPDAFDLAGISAAMARSLGQAVAKNHWTTTDSPEFKALQQKNADAMGVVTRGWLFLSDPKNGEDWWYAGKEVEAGTAGQAIMWYRPKGSAKYHVIDADLKVREVGAVDLPKGVGVQMGTK
jgi:outer membrane lipoprotein-sorting protein